MPTFLGSLSDAASFQNDISRSDVSCHFVPLINITFMFQPLRFVIWIQGNAYFSLENDCISKFHTVNMSNAPDFLSHTEMRSEMKSKS